MEIRQTSVLCVTFVTQEKMLKLQVSFIETIAVQLEGKAPLEKSYPKQSSGNYPGLFY